MLKQNAAKKKVKTNGGHAWDILLLPGHCSRLRLFSVPNAWQMPWLLRRDAAGHKAVEGRGQPKWSKKGGKHIFWSHFFTWTSSQWSIVEPCRVICLLRARQCCWSLSPWETAASARGWWVQGGCALNCWTSCQGHLYQHRPSALALPEHLNTWSFRSWNARWVWLTWLGESHVMN